MKYVQKLQSFLVLIFLSALLISAAGCTKEKKARVDRSNPSDDSMVEDQSKQDVVVTSGSSTTSSGGTTSGKTSSSTASTAKSSANPFEGTWDVNVSGSFANWTFGYASKSTGGDKLEGKITDSSSSVIGEYTVLPNKTVELNIYSGSSINIVPYKISNGGNQIEVNDGTTKVVLTKGKTNTTIQNDGNILASHGTWTNITNPSDQIQFSSVRKSGSGWNGSVATGSGSGTFSLTPGKIAFTIAGSVDTFTYKLRNSNSILDLTDSSGNTETYN